jgi:hypothetical protein
MTAPRFFAGDAVDPTTEVVSAADYDALAKSRATATDLELKGKSPFRRNLSLRVNEYGHFHASMHISARGSYRMLAWFSGAIADCRLVETEFGHNLWVAHSAFDVSDTEAQRIRETFEPLGLCIKEAKPAAAPTQAEATAVSP